MKKVSMFFALALFCMLTTQSAQAQIISIPDANFKNYLLAQADLNHDNDISVSEAAAMVNMIDVRGLGITDMTGIEYFTAAPGIACGNNQLTSLDVTMCTALRQLSCQNNQLASLNVAGLQNLELLELQNNQLTSINLSGLTGVKVLNVSNNPLAALNTTVCTSLERIIANSASLTALTTGALNNLKEVDCIGNTQPMILRTDGSSVGKIIAYNSNITALNVTNCTQLGILYCPNNNISNTVSLNSCTALNAVFLNNNDLSRLTVRNGNNTNIMYFYIFGNPNLGCVEVDNVAYSNANWTTKDPGTSYALGCNLGSGGGGIGLGPLSPKVNGGNTNTTAGATYSVTGFSSVEGDMNAQVFPNPTNGTVTIDLDATYKNVVVEAVNAVGQTVYNQTFTNAQRAELNLEGTAGMYMVTVRTEAGNQTFKVVKQ